MSEDTARSEWCAAFVAAQGRLLNVPKSKTAKVKTKSGADYSYSYAELPDIIDSVRLVLAENGLGFAQAITGDPQAIAITTTIYHAAGHSESFGPLLLVAGTTPQEAGSAITYGRRYHLCSVLGIAAEDDDDAGSVKARKASAAAPRKAYAGTDAAQPEVAAMGKGPASGGTSESPSAEANTPSSRPATQSTSADTSSPAHGPAGEAESGSGVAADKPSEAALDPGQLPHDFAPVQSPTVKSMVVCAVPHCSLHPARRKDATTVPA